ncbi:MAG: glycine oxidase [Blastocatellia bacterium]|jgi:glycine oxidase|nr:glycine oxidase [Blastocatellia bacterium]
MLNSETDLPSTSADVVIIGGGVIGLAIGRALALRGVSRVLIVERGRWGAEASSAAAGIIGPQAEANQADEFFQLACQSRDLYPAWAAALREESGTDIELDQTGTLYLAFTAADEAEAAHRYQWQTAAGYDLERLSASEARTFEPGISPAILSALRFPRDMQVDNRRLVAALTTANERLGVELAGGCDVGGIRTERERVRAVETSQGTIFTRHAIIAAGAWSSSISLPDLPPDIPMPRVRIEPVRGQMLCFETNPRLAQHVLYSPRGYLVPRSDGRLLAGSTSEHAGFEKRVTTTGIHTLTEQALEIIPGLGNLPLIDSWAGLRPRADDGLPVLGTCSDIEGLIYATGHFRNGILLAPITGELIADAVVGSSCGGLTATLLDAFSPDRFRFAGVQ